MRSTRTAAWSWLTVFWAPQWYTHANTALCRTHWPRTEIRPRPTRSFDGRVYAVASSDDSVVSAFARQLRLTFTILHNQAGDIQTIYQTTGVPESFVIDRDGTIIKKVIGAAEWDGPVNETLVRRLLDAR